MVSSSVPIKLQEQRNACRKILPSNASVHNAKIGYFKLYGFSWLYYAAMRV